MLLWTWVHKYIFELLLSVPWNTYSKVELLAHMRSLGEGNGNFLAWKIPWTEEPGELQSRGSPRITHDWDFHTVFHSGCIILHSQTVIHKGKERVFFSLLWNTHFLKKFWCSSIYLFLILLFVFLVFSLNILTPMPISQETLDKYLFNWRYRKIDRAIDMDISDSHYLH